METSVMLALRGDLVKLSDAMDGSSKATRFEAVNKGWVSISRPWSGLTESTGVGDPRKATAEKGQKYLDVVVPRLAKFLVDLSQANVLSERFPFL
jgi:creatinine amidohydrolase